MIEINVEYAKISEFKNHSCIYFNHGYSFLPHYSQEHLPIVQQHIEINIDLAITIDYMSTDYMQIHMQFIP